jgi:hypothetical protein
LQKSETIRAPGKLNQSLARDVARPIARGVLGNVGRLTKSETSMRRLFVAAMALACLNAPALASHRSYHHHSAKASVHGRHYARHGGAWCGAYMRHVFGVADPRLNLARNWASAGSNAGGPQVGAVVVWPHHVGVIRGGPDSNGDWLIESGNDGHAVRTRYRSLRGAIAFRSVGGGRAGAVGEQRQSRQPRYVGSNPSDFAWGPDNTASVTNERRRTIRVAQNWMTKSDGVVHW